MKKRWFWIALFWNEKPFFLIVEQAKWARKIRVILTSKKPAHAEIPRFFHDLPLIFKFLDFSMHRFSFSHFPCFPEPVETLQQRPRSDKSECRIWLWSSLSAYTNFYLSRAMRKCVMWYANNKGADQPAHPRSLISAFVVHCLDSIISLASIAEISRL